MAAILETDRPSGFLQDWLPSPRPGLLIEPRLGSFAHIKGLAPGAGISLTHTFMFTWITNIFGLRHNFPGTEPCLGYLPVSEPAINWCTTGLSSMDKRWCLGALSPKTLLATSPAGEAGPSTRPRHCSNVQQTRVRPESPPAPILKDILLSNMAAKRPHTKSVPPLNDKFLHAFILDYNEKKIFGLNWIS